MIPSLEGTREVNGTRAVERVVVMEGDSQVASQVGLHLVGELADRTGLTSGYSASVPWTGERAPVHDRGRLLAQLAVMLVLRGCHSLTGLGPSVSAQHSWAGSASAEV
jgi:hypothetical protein